MKLAVIIASVREGRYGPTIARWFAERTVAHGGFDVDIIDLADFELPLALPAVAPMMDPQGPRPASIAALGERLAAADAFVIVTPDYNRAYPASLKAAIDWFVTEWDAKTIGFVGYSGASGGILAIEGLRQVFNELNAHTVREYVSFPRYYLLFEDGELIEPAGPNAEAATMLDRLHWWSTALTAARGVAVG
ncbi:NADPH-dependent FMN reductase [Nocardia sp. NPDC127579]|uniref:NADPH-dependent FMN reductase n=1 Tax=Nocardia sp. NPDC127579 TaxID=3345402 RepID=UPI003638DE19